MLSILRVVGHCYFETKLFKLTALIQTYLLTSANNLSPLFVKLIEITPLTHTTVFLEVSKFFQY